MGHKVLYIHGMGGGADSRIPGILRERFAAEGDGIEVIVRTYDFDPETGFAQIASWVEELKPELIVGESLGANHAIAIKGLPHILVSPALNAPAYFGRLAGLCFIPGVTSFLDNKFHPKPGERQCLHFSYSTMKKYRNLRRKAKENTPLNGSKDRFFAFFGTQDHYRKSGVVSIRTWKKYFGENSFQTYPGTHFMEEEWVISLLMPKIREEITIFAGRKRKK